MAAEGEKKAGVGDALSDTNCREGDNQGCRHPRRVGAGSRERLTSQKLPALSPNG